MTGNEGLDDVHNLLLLVAGQFAHGFKNVARFASRAGAALFCLGHAQQVIGGYSQGGG